MDRTLDMPLLTDQDPVPPVAAHTVFMIQAVALGCGAVAALVKFAGLASPGLASTAVLTLVAIAFLAGGYALTLRPGDWRAWGLAAIIAFLAQAGFPAHWDSLALVGRVLGIFLSFGTAFAYWPGRIRYPVLSIVPLLHFGAIFTATSWPEPTPWWSNQSAQRVYMNYYKFFYLSNAYHFYSPEPGPASLLFVLIQYEITDPSTGAKRIESSWVDIPNREVHYKDPLGLIYQRRLSITELVAGTSPSSLTPDNFEKGDAFNRRKSAAVNVDDPTSRIPISTDIEPVAQQYRVPTPQITRYHLPSYARHIAQEYTTPERKVLALKIVRVEHRLLTPMQFLPQKDPETGAKRQDGTSPFDPLTYRPYYLGEYTPAGQLVNPTDPMLYWLLPIAPRNTPDAQGRNFDDYMSKYLKHEFPWERLAKGAQ